jgi:hypothetical protein
VAPLGTAALNGAAGWVGRHSSGSALCSHSIQVVGAAGVRGPLAEYASR